MNFKSGPPAQQDGWRAGPPAHKDGWRAGNDLYRKKQYDEAIRSYEKSLLSANKAVEAALNYNIGNCKFRQGKTKESSDLAGAIAQYRSSLDYYKRAMELAPQDKEAKFNHEFVERLLKTLIDKMKKQQQQKPGQQGQEGQQSKDQRQQQQGQKQKQQQQQEQQKEQQTNQAQQQQAQASQAQQQKQQQKGQKSQEIEGVGGDIASGGPPAQQYAGQAGKELDKEMSREEAGVLLDDYRQREQQDRQSSDKHKPQRYPDVEKDW